jgi:hypothetical protein
METFQPLYDMLQKISIPYKSGTNNRRGFPKHRATTFGIVRGRYTGRVGLSRMTLKYLHVYEELQRVGRAIQPDFYFTSIHVNHNVTCPRHVDSKNVGRSMVVAFGDYTGGQLVIDDEVIDTFCRPVVFDGSRKMHWNLPHQGEKYSLVYYNTLTT